MPPIHPLIVHIPIGSLLLAGIFFILELVLKKDMFRQAGFYALLIGVVGIIAAIVSGNLAEEDLVRTKAIQELLEDHATQGWITAWVFGLLTAWSYIRLPKTQGKAEKIIFVIVFWLAYGFAGLTAHHGGQLVYGQGAGVGPMQEILQQKATDEGFKLENQ